VPRKRSPNRFTSYSPPTPDPGDRHAATDHDRVRHALVDIDELADLPIGVRECLVDDLVAAVRYQRTGVDVRKRGVSNKDVGKGIYLSDVGRAVQRAGLPATRWRKWYDGGDRESLVYRVAHEVAEVTGVDLPRELKHLGKLAGTIRQG